MREAYRKFFGHRLVPFALILLVISSGIIAATQVSDNTQNRDFGKLVIKAGECSGHALALKPNGVSKEIRSSAQMLLSDDGDFMYPVIRLGHCCSEFLPDFRIAARTLNYFLLFRAIRR